MANGARSSVEGCAWWGALIGETLNVTGEPLVHTESSCVVYAIVGIERVLLLLIDCMSAGAVRRKFLSRVEHISRLNWDPKV